jgi:hypothetical protein
MKFSNARALFVPVAGSIIDSPHAERAHIDDAPGVEPDHAERALGYVIPRVRKAADRRRAVAREHEDRLNMVA